MKKISILALVGLILGSYIYFLELPKANEELFASRLFGDIQSWNINSIKVESTLGNYELKNSKPNVEPKTPPVSDSTESLSSELPEISWHLADIEWAPLDRATLDGLLQAVSNAAYTSKVDSPESDLSVYGLTNPTTKLQVQLNGTSSQIIFGEKNDYVSGRYVKFSDKPELYIIDDSLFTEITKTKDAIRSKTPITFADSSVKKLSINNIDKIIQVEPKEDRTFKITAPINVAASSIGVFDIYRNLRNLQVEKYIDGENSVKSYGFNTENLQNIVIEKKDGSKIEVKFLLNDGKVYFHLTGQNSVYQSVSNSLGSIFRSIDAIRDGQQFKFDPYNVTSLMVTKGNETILDLYLNKGNWMFRSDSSASDTPFVREYLKQVSDTQAASFLPQSDTEWAKNPAMTLMISGDDSRVPFSKKILIGQARNGGQIPAILENSNEPFLITEDSLKKITPSLEKFKIVPAIK